MRLDLGLGLTSLTPLRGADVLPRVTLPLDARFVDDGDSIDQGSNGPTHLETALAMSGGRFYQSIPMHTSQAGRKASDIVGRIATINALNPDYFFYGGGTNDLGSGVSATTIWNQYDIPIIQGVLGGTAKGMMIRPVTPRDNGAFFWSPAYEDERKALNALRANYANEPRLRKFVNRIDWPGDFDAIFNTATDTVDLLHPNQSGKYKIGAQIAPFFASRIVSTDRAALYTDPAYLLLAANNPQLSGTGGTKSAASGSVADSWVLAGGSAMGCAGSKTTLNGAPAQRFVLSGTNNNANQLARFYTQWTGTMNIGEAYEAWVDILVASGSALLQRVYLQFSPFSVSYNANRTETSVTGYTGVLRTLPQIITTQQVNPLFQIDLNFSVGTVAADITIGRTFAGRLASI